MASRIAKPLNLMAFESVAKIFTVGESPRCDWRICAQSASTPPTRHQCSYALPGSWRSDWDSAGGLGFRGVAGSASRMSGAIHYA